MSTDQGKDKAGPGKRPRVRRIGRHGRFLIAFGVGLAVLAISLGLSHGLGLSLPMGEQVLIPVNVFFLCYLLMMLRLTQLTPHDLRARAAREDEGTALIITLAALSFVISVTAIFLVLNRTTDGNLIEDALALAAVPLGWAMIHTLAAFHYAHLFYQPDPAPGPGDMGGLTFPDTPDPGVWDFLYLAFGVGMTAQVSDVVVTGTPMRRVVLTHAIVAFFTNTVILALAVNAAVTIRV